MKLVELYHTNKAALDTVAYDKMGNRASVSERSFSSAQPLKLPAVREKAVDWRTKIVMKYHHLFTDYALLTTMCITLTICVISTFIVYLHTNNYTTTNTKQCDGRWEPVPMYIFMGIGIILILTTLLPFLRSVQDAYGLRTEIIILLTIGLASFFITALLDTISFDVLPQWCKSVPTNLIGMISMCGMQICTVVLPMARIWWWNKDISNERTTSVSTVHLDALCSNPVWMADLRQFSVKDFSAGNVLFLERYARFHNRFFCNRNAAVCDFAAMLSELEIIYANFFSPKANIRIDISEETRQELDRQFTTRQLNTGVFERAYQEVWRALTVRTLPLYQQHISSTSKTAHPTVQGRYDVPNCNCKGNICAKEDNNNCELDSQSPV
ncbi:hypothetical protein BDF19DRAFT_423953 [Syncephalis fuscata]|nr:hypothetical protein BDF19DRAFT_423953 [Syncephalis fuscata]